MKALLNSLFLLIIINVAFAQENPQAKLFNSIMKMDVNATKEAILAGASVNGTINAFVPLYYAVEANNMEMVKMLLEQKADINAKGPYEKVPIMAATSKKHFEMLKFLLENGASIESKGMFNAPLLNVMLEKSVHLDIIKFLVEKGADPEAKGGFDMTTIAAMKTNFGGKGYISYHQKNKHLYDSLKMVYPEYYFNFSESDFSSPAELASYLVDKGVDPEDKAVIGSPITLAVQTNNLELAKFLISKEVEINSIIPRPLNSALQLGFGEMTKLLIEAGADIEKEFPSSIDGFLFNFDALPWACWYGQLEVVKILLDKGADINKTYESFQKVGDPGYTEMMTVTATSIAADKGFEDLLNYLKSKGGLGPKEL